MFNKVIIIILMLVFIFNIECKYEIKSTTTHFEKKVMFMKLK